MSDIRNPSARKIDVPVSSGAPVSGERAADIAADLAPNADRILKVTGSLCPECVAEGAYDDLLIPMVVYEAEGEILLAKECDDHGEFRDVYWSDASLYYWAHSWGDDTDHLRTTHQVPEGGVACPTDCGLCPLHKSHTGLGNITVTNRCDRSCWYCFFYAEEDDPLYEPSKEQIREMAERMANEDPIGANAIQLTGGEPAVRDDLVEIVETVDDVVRHVQLNTHSAILAGDPERVQALSDAGVDTVYTSFDGVDPETNAKNYWELPEAIRTYRDSGMAVVLVPTIIGGQNADQLGDIIRFAMANSDLVRGVNFQPVSIVGRMPDHERHAQRVTIPDAIHAIEAQTDGAIPADAWFPIPSALPISELAETWHGEPMYELSNHFACGMATYAYLDGDDLVPITEFFDVEPFLQRLHELSDRFEGDLSVPEKTRLGVGFGLALLRAMHWRDQPEEMHLGRWLLEALTDGTYDGLVEFHEHTLFLGMMHFMDPYNYDVDRVERCDVHYSLPDGRVVPFCAYNVLPELYRDSVHDEYAIGVEEWLDRDYTGLTDAEAPEETRLRSETITASEDDQEFLRDGPGVFGYDVKTSRDLDADERERIDRTYERAIEDLEPV